MLVLIISGASVLLLLITIFSLVLRGKNRRIAILKTENSNLSQTISEKESNFKEQEENLRNQLRIINSSIEDIEIKCSEMVSQNTELTQQLKRKNIDLRLLEHRMSKLAKESTGYDVALFIEWLNDNGINTEQARLMVNNATDTERQLNGVKVMYDKLESEKRLLENYADSISKQLQIVLKSNQ